MNSLHLFTQNTLPRGKGSGKDKASCFQAIPRDFPKHQQLQVFFALNCMSLSKGSIFLYQLKRANKSSLSPSWCGRWAHCVPTLPSMLKDPPEQSLCSFPTCLLAQHVHHAASGTGSAPQQLLHRDGAGFPAANAIPAVPLATGFATSAQECTNICSMLELSWVTLRGNATKSVSNTVGSNKTRVNCNGYKQKE